MRMNGMESRKTHFSVRLKIKDQRGILAVDYLFALVIGMGLFLLFFALSFTLSMGFIAQYVAFSASRSFASGHKAVENQEALARNKFNELKNNNVFGPLFQNGWFTLEIESLRSGGAGGQDFSQDYKDELEGVIRQPAVGLRLNFTSSILNFRNPLLGNSQSEEEGGFRTRVTGLMNREPTAAECVRQMRREVRYVQILSLDSRYSILGNPAQLKYFAFEDNGC
jgi:hypothetical protein